MSQNNLCIAECIVNPCTSCVARLRGLFNTGNANGLPGSMVTTSNDGAPGRMVVHAYKFLVTHLHTAWMTLRQVQRTEQLLHDVGAGFPVEKQHRLKAVFQQVHSGRFQLFRAQCQRGGNAIQCTIWALCIDKRVVGT